MALRLENHRRRGKRSAFTTAEKKQLAAVRYFTWDMDDNDFRGAEGLDVVDDTTGKVIYQLWLWTLGGGALYRNGTRDIVAEIGEYDGKFHAAVPDRTLRRQLADAYPRACKTFKLKQRIEFSGDERATPPKPVRPRSIAKQLSEWRRAAKAGTPPATDDYFRLVIMDALGAPAWHGNARPVFRPYPVRRWFELDAVARSALELLVDLQETSDELLRLGLPEDLGDLARFIGRPPFGPLDETVMIDGKRHAVWALVSDAVYEQRPVARVVGYLKRLPEKKLAAVWRALAEMPSTGTGTHHLKTYFPTTEKAYADGFPLWYAPTSFDERFAELLVEIAPSSKDVDATIEAGLAAFRRKKWERYTTLSFERDAANAALVALRGVHAAAKQRGGMLGPEHDELLAKVMSSTRDPLPLAYSILDDLPIERSGKIAGSQFVLLARYPTLDGVRRAIRRLEKPEWWLEAPFYDGLFTQLVVKVGSDAGSLLEAAIARKPPAGRAYMRKIIVKRMKQALAELKKRTSAKQPRASRRRR